ncbi:pitrilysin family protein [Oscillatoria sp. CS-180]|uniref:M16 family metallopeptidase n=1 Tax=Oscillatoria sp. CS-180 TaxID=3021720 RepID=UPI00232E80C4|nr:pitrilysin family protein [Oscillatoria sp. CS-180]MDB9528153.1 pitrilysin family protein [Oscillatoria sp. CS-180]
MTSAPPSFPATIHRLENGLTVVHQHMPATPVVVADVWVNAGAALEPVEWTGMAHFLEHMVFKGTERLLPGMFDYAIETRGGFSNAATSHDYAHFYMALAASALPDTLPYLADLVLHAAIPADEFVRERQVVLEEIRQAKDDPDWIGFQAMSEQVFPNHAYGRPVLGTEEILSQRSPEEMRHFHQAHYQPQNMTVVVAGGVSLDPTLEMVRHAFRAFATPLEITRETGQIQPWWGVQRQILRVPRLEHARLMMAWLGPGVDNLDAACGMDILSAVLAEGRSARLVRELREERQWVLDITSSFSLQRDCSLFTLQAWLDPDHVDPVEALICDRLSTLADQPISHAELDKAKRLLVNDFAFSTETPGQLAGLYGYYSVVASASDSYTYPARINAYTPASLSALAKQFLSANTYASTVLLPAS